MFKNELCKDKVTSISDYYNIYLGIDKIDINGIIYSYIIQGLHTIKNSDRKKFIDKGLYIDPCSDNFTITDIIDLFSNIYISP